MRQENKVSIKNKITVDFRLTRSLEILRASSSDLGKLLDDYALENPFIKVVKPIKDDKLDFISNIAQKKSTSLDMHIISQLSLKKISEMDKRHLHLLISMIDSNGYLNYKPSDLSNCLKIALDETKRLIRIIQSLDPVGIGTRNYIESFAIQLHAKKLLTKEAKFILSKHFKHLAHRQFNEIEKSTGITIEYCKKLLSEIKKLNPHPASGFNVDDSIYIEPDFIIKLNNGKAYAKLSDKSIYKVEVHKDYQFSGINSSDKKIINTMLYNANYISHALQKRYETLLKITRKIVEIQQGYFIGTDSLCAMTKKDIAKYINMHPSTVSRALKNKYVLFNDTVKNVDWYFSGKSQLSDGQSPFRIKEVIQYIIESEDKNHPESDDRIAFLLNNSGVKISRRTVSKYRSNMGIPSSSLRKRIKYDI